MRSLSGRHIVIASFAAIALAAALLFLPIGAFAEPAALPASASPSADYSAQLDAMGKQLDKMSQQLDKLQASADASSGTVWTVDNSQVVQSIDSLRDDLEGLNHDYTPDDRLYLLLECLCFSVLLGDGLLVGFVCFNRIGRHT